MPIRLAIVDGHTLTRYGLNELIAQHSDIEVVAECTSACDASSVIGTVRPDVVTVDVTLPDGNGLQLAREFRDRYADLGIVILTSHGEDDVLFRALETGASAFVAKTAPVEEVLAAIRHAAVAASSFTASGLAVALARRRNMQEQIALSPREMAVLRLLRDGMSIPAIAVAMFISKSTAKTYVARLYDKLGAANRAQALMAAIRYGLIHYEDEVLSAEAAHGMRRARLASRPRVPSPAAAIGGISVVLKGRRAGPVQPAPVLPAGGSQARLPIGGSLLAAGALTRHSYRQVNTGDRREDYPSGGLSHCTSVAASALGRLPGGRTVHRGCDGPEFTVRPAHAQPGPPAVPVVRVRCRSCRSDHLGNVP
jgi:DNA-binding NarL/FixJ family response regulator